VTSPGSAVSMAPGRALTGTDQDASAHRMRPPSYPGPECSRFPVRMGVSRITESSARRCGVARVRRE
jgi:hypothetical protein